MGSAMSGIYTPILSLLAFIVIARQLQAQHEINKHQIDHAYIEQSRNDIQYFLDRLEVSLKNKDSNEVPWGMVLKLYFLVDDPKELNSEELNNFAKAVNLQNPQLYSLWAAIYSIVNGLRVNSEFPYEHNAIAAIQKISTVVPFSICVALDNYHKCIVQDRYDVRYEFSELLKN